MSDQEFNLFSREVSYFLLLLIKGIQILSNYNISKLLSDVIWKELLKSNVLFMLGSSRLAIIFSFMSQLGTGL